MTTVEASAVDVAPLSPPSASPAAYSVVIEWENVKLAEAARASEMLRQLSAQMAVLARGGLRGEILLICDGDDEDGNKELAEMLRSTLGPAASAVKIVRIWGGKYYEKKNKGASSAEGSIVVFLDSDVIPEEHWLERMISAFDQPEVDIVAGTTYLDPSSLYAKAFAAFWFFPPRSKEEGLAPARLMFANNIAFRRQLLLENPLPDLPQFRGQLGALIQRLRESGKAHMFVRRDARCSHPAPNGFVHFIRRAMCEGHDNVIRAQRETGRSRLPWRQSYWSVRALLDREFQAIRERAEPLGLTAAPLVAARTLALAYAAIAGMGEVATRWNPNWVRRHFAI